VAERAVRACGGAVGAGWQQGVAGEHRGGSQGGAGQGGGARGTPERWVDGEAAQTASGGDVHRRQGRSGGRRRVWMGPAAQGRPEGGEEAVN
jgi:hypothetical protein